jgi:polysaccharide pyruvyl transferase WcaK-like protein
MSTGFGARGEDDCAIYQQHFSDDMPCLDDHLDTTRGFQRARDVFFQSLLSSRIVLATRLHAAISSAMCGVPTVAIAYERKVAVTFAELGLGDFVVSPAASAETIAHAGRMALSPAGRDAFERARATRHTVRRNLVSALAPLAVRPH